MAKKPTYEELEQRVKELEKEAVTLKRSEEKFTAIVHNSQIATAVGGSDGSIIAFNEALEVLTGYKRSEINDVTEWANKLYPDQEYRSFVWENIQQALNDQEQDYTEFTITCKDGSTKFIDFFTSFFQNNLIIQMIDITERKETEEALRVSEEKYRSLITNIPDVTWTTDSEGKTSFVSPNAENVFGYTPKEIYEGGDSIFPGRIHPEDAERVERAMKKLFEKGTIFDVEYRIKRKDGEWIWGHDRSTTIYEKDGVMYTDGIFSNITSHKRAEEALRDSEEKFSRLFFSSPIWVTLSKLEDGTYLEANHAFEESTGFDRKDVIGRTSVEFGLWADPRERERFKKLAQDEGGFRTQEVTFLTKKGDPLTILWSADVIELDGEACLLSTATDISELKQAEEEKIKLQDQLHRAQRMESLGLMAGGIAHDLNNILSGIVSYPELLLMDIPTDSPMRKPMETIKESGMRAVDVVADLLTIARGVATGKEPLNLNTIVAEYLGSAEHQKLERTRAFIDFKAELNPDLLNLIGSSTHINKTLMNLVMNASEAIEGAGTVTISTMNRYLDEPLKGYEAVRIGEYAVLSVSDDGSGISAENLEKIFEPFYTKKVMGRSGTGLGLAVVWNSVQDHNGYIDVKSSEKGTVFELYFPVTRDQIAEDKEDVPVAEYQGHGERILVVDDEERQREIACGMLTKLGYIAEAVSSGEGAIEYVKEHPVDLIVLDMVMPKGINGRETYEEIIKIRPEQKAIIASGYAKTKEVDIAQELGAGKYIKKPYTLPKVGLAVKEELEK